MLRAVWALHFSIGNQREDKKTNGRREETIGWCKKPEGLIS